MGISTIPYRKFSAACCHASRALRKIEAMLADTGADRKKELIIAGGYNIYPGEVEEVPYQHPKVKEAVCYGMPDEYRGETVKVTIVAKEGELLTQEEIVEFCRDKLAKYKMPKKVEFRKELPKSMIGKVLRRVLVEKEKAKNKKGRTGACSGE